MERTVLKKQRLVSLWVAIANFVVFLGLFLASHSWAVQLLESRLRSEAQVNLKFQKSAFQAAFDTNFLLLRALETRILERKDLPDLTNVTKNLARQLLPLSNSVVALGFAIGNPQQPWTAWVFKNPDNKLNWDDQRPFRILAQKAVMQRKIAFELLVIDQKELLLMAQPIFEKEQLWGFAFAEINFVLLLQEFVNSRQQANYSVGLFIPDSSNPDFRDRPALGSLVLSTDLPNPSKPWIFFATPNAYWHTPVFPFEMAVPMMIGIAFFIGLTVFLLNSERLKSRWLALFDPLTNVANRRYLEQYFRKNSVGSAGHLLLFNVDNFREINEKYGFAVGDQILIEIAARLKQALQPTDFLARLGNDEFVMLMPQQLRGGITNVSHHIQQTMTEPMLINQQMISLVTIIGSSCYPEHGTELNALVEHADHHALRSATPQG